MRLKWTVLAAACLVPSSLFAQRRMYLGALGGFATLSGDGRSVVMPTSASTSLFAPRNGAAADFFVGLHFLDYVSFQLDYVWNRNDAVLTSNLSSSSAVSFFRQPETVTQSAILAGALVYFRKRPSRIRPYLFLAGGGVLIRSRFSPGGLLAGSPSLPPASSDRASPALRTSVGLDLRLRRSWYFRYSFGETIARDSLGKDLSPPELRTPKNFQNLFGLYYRF